MDLAGKTVLILGLGAYETGSGVSAAVYCARNKAARVIVTDLRSAAELDKTVRQLRRFKSIEFVFGTHRLQDVDAADLVVKNPGVPDDIPVVQRAQAQGIPMTNDIGLFLDAKPLGPVIAVTGTRGKSTTATLIYELLRQKTKRVFLGGNIGVSPLRFVADMQADDITVLELSSWMLHDLAAPRFTTAVVTNVLPDHLNRYASMFEYQKDKERIFRYQTADGHVVLNAANSRTKQMAKRAKGRVSLFGKGSGVHGTKVIDQMIVSDGDRITTVGDVQLLGAHNIENVCAAVAVAREYGVSKAAIRQVLRHFTGVPNRLEEIRVHRGVKYYNDTTATTPDAAAAALKSFDRRVILLAGGNTKGLDLDVFVRLLARKTKHVFLLEGNANQPIREVLPKERITEIAEIEDAVQQAAAMAQPGDIVLLSPGCTWLPKMNEFERGRRFVAAVTQLD